MSPNDKSERPTSDAALRPQRAAPERLPTTAQMLVDPEIAKAIGRVLVAYGVDWQDVEDGRQEVYVRALASFQRTDPPPEPPPDTLERMEALCVEIAKNYAIDLLRAAATRERDLVEGCDPSELAPLRPAVPRRDPVDTGRELEVLAQLFRDGKMPEDGVDILEGLVDRCSYAEIAQEHAISADLVEWRYREMKRIYRRRMTQLGLMPDMPPLRLVASNPGAIARLRGVA